MTPQSTATAKPVDTVAIDERQWHALSSPDTPETRPHLGPSNRRRHERPSLREVAQLFLGIGLSRGKQERFLVRTRNISGGGVGFSHSRALRRGVLCQVRILTRHSRVVDLPGVVASCRRRHDGLFEVGVMFGKSVNVNEFIGPPAA